MEPNLKAVRSGSYLSRILAKESCRAALAAGILLNGVLLSGPLLNEGVLAADSPTTGSAQEEAVAKSDPAEARRILGPLAEPDVQEELGLSNVQIADLMRVASKIAEIDRRTREELATIRGKTAEERKKEVADAAEERIAGLEGVLDVILNNDQQKKLREIVIQRRLTDLAENPRAGKELKLSEDQRQQLTNAWKETRNKLAELKQSNLSGGDRDAAEKLAMKEFTGKASEILSEEQRQKVAEKRTGRKERPFDVSVARIGDRPQRAERTDSDRGRSEQRNRKPGSSRASSGAGGSTRSGLAPAMGTSPLQGPLANGLGSGSNGAGTALAGNTGGSQLGPSQLGNASGPEKAGDAADAAGPKPTAETEQPKPAEPKPTEPETPTTPAAPTTPTLPVAPGSDGAPPVPPKDEPTTTGPPKLPPPKPNF